MPQKLPEDIIIAGWKCFIGRRSVRCSSFREGSVRHMKGVGMKRAITLTIVVVLALSLSAVLTGCGGDTKQAQQYMKAGDSLVTKLQKDSQTWQTEVSSSFANTSDPAAFSAAINQAKSSANELSATAGEAKAEYAKIKSLKGVPDYVKYADLEIQAMDLFQQLIKETNTFFDQIVAMANSGDLTSVSNAQKAYTDTANKIGAQISKLDQQAQKLKSDKNL